MWYRGWQYLTSRCLNKSRRFDAISLTTGRSGYWFLHRRGIRSPLCGKVGAGIIRLKQWFCLAGSNATQIPRCRCWRHGQTMWSVFCLKRAPPPVRTGSDRCALRVSAAVLSRSGRNVSPTPCGCQAFGKRQIFRHCITLFGKSFQIQAGNFLTADFASVFPKQYPNVCPLLPIEFVH